MEILNSGIRQQKRKKGGKGIEKDKEGWERGKKG